MPDERQIDRRRLLWAGPVTVVSAIGAVLIVRVAAVAVLHVSPGTFQPLEWFFPIFDTLVLVTAAVIVFAVVSALATKPVRTYRWIALAALAVSMIPDLQIHARRPEFFTWPRTSALMIMHVVAWWVTVTMLTRLARCSKPAD